MSTFTTMRGLIESHGTMLPVHWVYLPSDGPWHLDMPVLVAGSIEVPPELENEPLAGYPKAALDRNMMCFLELATLFGVIDNARMQSADLSIEDHYDAIMHYWEYDAYKLFGR